eukprot:2008138-Pleurochrysis_carterae.AAC.1
MVQVNYSGFSLSASAGHCNQSAPAGKSLRPFFERSSLVPPATLRTSASHHTYVLRKRGVGAEDVGVR